MIKALIIDDEQHCIDRLSHLLKTQHAHEVELGGAFQSVPDGMEAIKNLQPRLVFLDVQIGDMTGFDLLRQSASISFDVVFVTAYEKYAVQAFKFSAIDYLLKPVDAAELAAAIRKVKEKKETGELHARLDSLFHNLKGVQQGSRKICVPTSSGYVFVEVQDIIRCESEINYTTLYLRDKRKMLVSKTLKEFEDLLTEFDFFRIHNSHLINLAFIQSYNKGKGGFVTLTDNTQVEVSTRRKDEFLRVMGKRG